MSTRCKYYVRKLPILARQSLVFTTFWQTYSCISETWSFLFYLWVRCPVCRYTQLPSSCSCNCVTCYWVTLSCRLIHSWALYGNFCNPDNIPCTNVSSWRPAPSLYVQRVVIYYLWHMYHYMFQQWLVNLLSILVSPSSNPASTKLDQSRIWHLAQNVNHVENVMGSTSI